MICFVKGAIDQINEQSVYVDVSGVGYEVFVPIGVLANVRVGEDRKLFTYQQVKEDDLRLFGFVEKRDLEIFRLLIEVNGIGPKAGLAILSAYSADQIAQAILIGDERLFASVSGIGKKGAAKIVIDLKGRVSGVVRQNVSVGGQEKLQLPDTQNDLIDALVGLGYTEREIYQNLAKIDQSKDLNGQIKQALGLLAKG